MKHTYYPYIYDARYHASTTVLSDKSGLDTTDIYIVRTRLRVKGYQTLLLQWSGWGTRLRKEVQ